MAADQNKKEENKREGESKVVYWVKELAPYVVVVAAALFLNTFIIINAKIPSASMETTIMTGERVFGIRTMRAVSSSSA